MKRKADGRVTLVLPYQTLPHFIVENMVPHGPTTAFLRQTLILRLLGSPNHT